MAIHYDQKHQPSKLETHAYIQLVCDTDTGYHVLNASKLSPVVLEPFPIWCKVLNIAYELDLLLQMHIHLVISVAHLKPCLADNWERQLPEDIPLVIVDGIAQYEIEHILE